MQAMIRLRKSRSGVNKVNKRAFQMFTADVALKCSKR